ncbi:hypothetical protein B6N60_05237 [Richelia sinica FACHB-800]|uniref:Uncharacterized protein n=1 Tax=Richelia sinica FACHB-800 TaxID=1357546 RepID=A0A975Y7N2_9NOST|nr:hypothetical protein [Richelia sinica]QXE26504.1 hypothetical protein B6N60_05237 [Richelia sinica FACHB-800]
MDVLTRAIAINLKTVIMPKQINNKSGQDDDKASSLVKDNSMI